MATRRCRFTTMWWTRRCSRSRYGHVPLNTLIGRTLRPWAHDSAPRQVLLAGRVFVWRAHNLAEGIHFPPVRGASVSLPLCSRRLLPPDPRLRDLRHSRSPHARRYSSSDNEPTGGCHATLDRTTRQMPDLARLGSSPRTARRSRRPEQAWSNLHESRGQPFGRLRHPLRRFRPPNLPRHAVRESGRRPYGTKWFSMRSFIDCGGAAAAPCVRSASRSPESRWT